MPEPSNPQREEPWTIGRILQWTQGHFASKGIDSPRLDAELLLARVLGKNRVYLYTHYDQPLTQSERDAYREMVRRRARLEPVAYILGEREFYGRPFVVTRDVLVPRPETEHLIDAVREWLGAHPELTAPRIVDVGTGSGIIAVTLAAVVKEAAVLAIDLSPQALAVARDNATRHGVAERITFCEGSLLAPAQGRGPFQVIAANLPYVSEADRPTLAPDVRDHEPAMALFAGDNGLALVRALIAAAPPLSSTPGLVALEIGAGQWPEVRAALEATGVFSRIWTAADLAGHARVALGERL